MLVGGTRVVNGDDDSGTEEDPVTGLSGVLLLMPPLDDSVPGVDEDAGVGVMSETEEYELIDAVPGMPGAELPPDVPGPPEDILEGTDAEVDGRTPELIDTLEYGTVDPLDAGTELPSEEGVTGLTAVELDGPVADGIDIEASVVVLHVV